MNDEVNEDDHEMNEGDQSFSSYEGKQIISISEDQSMLVLEDDQRNLLKMSSNEYISENTFNDILKESEAVTNADFPNEVYADLIALVTKYNLSNATGNTIIKFFNKYMNLSIFPLSKSMAKLSIHFIYLRYKLITDSDADTLIKL